MRNRSLVRTFGLIGATAPRLHLYRLQEQLGQRRQYPGHQRRHRARPTATPIQPTPTSRPPPTARQPPTPRFSAPTPPTPPSSRVKPTSSSSAQNYQQQAPAPIVQGYNDQDQSAEYAGEDAVAEYADQPPPPLPEYDQPPAPEDNYLWTPGYWAWGPGGYYWVPGVWCPPPYYGALWTPPYWGYYGGRYGFHHGYWGPHIGYYGGVDYGFGYVGIGYFGGYWHGNNFYYNRTVTNVGRVHNVYNRTVVFNNVTYNGMQPATVSATTAVAAASTSSPVPSEIGCRCTRPHAASARAASGRPGRRAEPAAVLRRQPRPSG